MQDIRNLFSFTAALVTILILLGCSSGSNPVKPSETGNDLPETFGLASEDGRSLVGAYIAKIDPQAKTFTIEPAERIGTYHIPISDLYSVISVTWFDFGPPFEADIKLTHPMPGSGIDGFDARVIAVLPANVGVSMNYPGLDVLANNSVLLEPDGYTDLWDKAYNGNVNPFVSYFKDETNRVWSSTGNTEETLRWTMDLSGFGGPLLYLLVCDVSTNYPAPPTPVTDNCPEPAEIVNILVGSGLTPTPGSSTSIRTTVLDWQGLNNIEIWYEIPGLFIGVEQIAYSGLGPNQNEFVFDDTVTNDLGAPEGVYSGLIGAEDAATTRIIYEEFTVTVHDGLPGDWELDPDRGNVDMSSWTMPTAPGSDIAVVNGPDPEVNAVLMYDELFQVIKADLNLTDNVLYGTAILPNDQDPSNPHPNPTEPMQAGRIDGSDNGQVVRTFVDGHIGLGPANNGLYQRCDSLVYMQHPENDMLAWTVAFFTGTDDNPATEDIDESQERVKAVEIWDEAYAGLDKWTLGFFWAGTLLWDETHTYNPVGCYGAFKDPYYDFVELFVDWGLWMSTGAPYNEIKGSDASNGLFPYHYRAYCGPESGPAVVYWHMKDPPDYIAEYYPVNPAANLLDFELIPLQDPPLEVNGITQLNDWGAILLDDKTVEIFDPMREGDQLVITIDIAETIGDPVYFDIDDSNADIFISHTDGTLPYCSVFTLWK